VRPADRRRYSPRVTSELQELRAALDGLRAGVLKKAAGLIDAYARRSTVHSGTNLAGLLQHLTFVESLWFEEIAGGGRRKGIGSMKVDPSVSLRTLRSDYRAACETSDRILEAIGDPEAPVKRNGETHSLRWGYLQSSERPPRHAGHAAIIRQQIDGQTGGDPG
jgi:hypothetical protein